MFNPNQKGSAKPQQRNSSDGKISVSDGNFSVAEKTMSSVEIADIAGKNHKDVLRAIRSMEPAWVKVSGRNFAPANYTDDQGKPRPMYELTHRECLYVATKFNDEARAKLVIRWEQLETERLEAERKALGSSVNFTAALRFIESMCKTTRMSDNSKLSMYRDVAEEYGVNVTIPPDGEDEITAGSEQSLIGIILGETVTVSVLNGSFRKTIGELIRLASDRDKDMYIAPSVADRELQKVGIRCIGEGVSFANSHPELIKMLAKTPYKRNYHKVLQRVPNATKVRQHYFGGVYSRATNIPYNQIGVFTSKTVEP